MAFNRQRLNEVAKPRSEQEIRIMVLRKVKRIIRREGWWEITDKFIEDWFNFFYEKLGNSPLDIVAKILDEFDLATGKTGMK